MRITKRVVPFALTLCALAPARAIAQPARGEVLILGVYHMNNPGRDIFNTQADDVLTPKRQIEMAQLVETLKRFRPTKIAVERDPGDRRLKSDYADYLAGTHPLTRNEIEQIGFRLAKELGHKNIYGVDADGEFPFPRVVKYAKATGRSNDLDALNELVGNKVKAQNAYLLSHTILEMLLNLNSDNSVAQDVGFYYRQAEFGEPWDWAGADLVADWYRRNLRIYTNIVQLAESPNERILAIFGSGHLGWLRQPFAANPDFRLRKLAELVE